MYHEGILIIASTFYFRFTNLGLQFYTGFIIQKHFIVLSPLREVAFVERSVKWSHVHKTHTQVIALPTTMYDVSIETMTLLVID